MDPAVVAAVPRQPRGLYRGLLHRVGSQSLLDDRSQGRAAVRRGEEGSPLLGGATHAAAKNLAHSWADPIGPARKQEWSDRHQEMEQALARFGRFVNEVEGHGRG